ncbi:unnamed protein product [Phyllotreta striolata]|uniref:MMS19 nucleotide excision repair protein n=1 Tax=Phyllotreta striolata TaxID=444603 RepID=A0A9N9TTL7_PHYSR|nr:unnamed protein product [Phyllotreta striolata]
MEFNYILNQLENGTEETFKTNCLLISTGIREGKSTILELIESLGRFLTDASISKRELGISILNEVLKSIPIDYLSTQQLEVLVEFYSSKFNDHHQIFPVALSGTLVLLGFENFPRPKLSHILSAIFQHVPCQQQQRVDRFTIFQILEICIKNFKQEVHDMENVFVCGLHDAVDGERDPRNLLFLLKWMREFTKEFKLYFFTEKIFDALASYFPVDFRTPLNDNSITREDLANALCPCLCANPEFGDSCISLALEKLDSSLEIAKLDSLALLREGCSTFKSSLYMEQFPNIWPLIQKEVLCTNSPTIRTESFLTLQKIVSKISTEDCLGHIKNIIDTVKGNLLPDSKLFQVSTQILICTAAASEKSCNFIVKEILPIIMNIYKMCAYVDHKSLIVQPLVDLMKEYFKYNKSLDDQEVPDLLNVPLLCLDLLKNDDTLKIGLDYITVLIPHLDSKNRETLYSEIQRIMFKIINEQTMLSLIQLLITCAGYYPEEVKCKIFTIDSQSHLPDAFLRSLAHLVTLQNFKDYVISTYLELLKKNVQSETVMKHLRYLVEQQRDNYDLLRELIEKNVLCCIYDSYVNSQFFETNISQDVYTIMTLLVALQPSEFQSKILGDYFERIFLQEMNEKTFIILYGLTAALRREVQLDKRVFEVALKISETSNNEFLVHIAVQLLGNLVNKIEDVKEFLSSCKIITTQKSFQRACFITKGLILRNYPDGYGWLHLSVRIECLKCLTLFTTVYPEMLLLPYKSKVLKQLAVCVDDKKRLVRKEAMEARAFWWMVGENV